MSNSWYKYRYLCVYGWALLVLLIGPAIYYVHGFTEYNKIRTYVQTNCLVKKLVLNKCGTRYHGISFHQQHCFQPIWLVKYIDYGINDTIAITDHGFWVNHEDTSDEIGSFKKYKIGEIYPCYHSSSARLTKAQWNKPSFSTFLYTIIYGTVWMLLYICMVLEFYWYKRRSDRNRRNRTFRYNRSTASTATGTEMRHFPSAGQLRHIRPIPPEEADVLEAPPPPYTPSFDHVDQNGIPLRSASTVHTEGEEENIPLSPPPPPPYTP